MRDVWTIPVVLLLLVGTAVWWFYSSGCILYFGDAQAHLNISRSILDSRTPGYQQLGTVWLPLPHVICLPFVSNLSLWSTGLAGSIPVALCFVIAGSCFYFAAKDAYGDRLAAAVVLACFTLNPNVLYLASIPMTEMVFLAGLAVYLFALLKFRATRSDGYLAVGVAAAWAMSLTRYDGWFLIPFAALAMAACARQKRLRVLVLFGCAAALAPLYWIAHNWWQTGNPLDFYNGPYSAAAIQGGKSYPGYHDWKLAVRYYFEAGRLCAGWGLLAVGALGLVCAVWKRKVLGSSFLLLTPLFYVWSMYSSKGTPIFLPTLWPHGYYNSRYGIAVVALCAFAAGAVVIAIPAEWRRWTALLAAVSVAGWVMQPSRQNWICWKESDVNSVSRRAWTKAGAQFLQANYQGGDGVLTEFGDLTGIFGRAELPLRESIHEGNGPEWFANTGRTGIVREAKWAIAQEGDWLARRIAEADSYELREAVAVEGAKTLVIFERKHVVTHE